MRLSTKQFSVNKVRKSFVEEHSTLGNQSWSRVPFHKFGVILTSHVTGEESRWYIDSVDYCDSNHEDIAGWNLLPTPESIRKFPRLAGWTMLIIND